MSDTLILESCQPPSIIHFDWNQAEKSLVQKLYEQYESGGGGSPLDADIVTMNGTISIQLSVLCAINREFKDVVSSVQDGDRVVLACPKIDMRSLRLGIQFIFTGNITVRMDQIKGEHM